MHLIWKAQTTQGVYAIKKINKNIPLDLKIKAEYELTERIARDFQLNGIPACTSITKNNNAVIDAEGDSFIVFPWIDGKILSSDKITCDHAVKIARLVARMHNMRYV